MSVEAVEATLYAQNLIAEITGKMTGRMCYEQNNCNYLAWAVSRAGDGDHLEIGTLHGGSAVLAALVKKDLDLKGDVWCVDPLDGYYAGTPFACPVDYVSQVPVTQDIVLSNAARFGVGDRIRIVKAKSLPWPAELPARFASAYIDGNHWGEVPLLDWLNVAARTDRVVVFDNVDISHRDVMQAAAMAETDPAWKVTLRRGITEVLERSVL